MKLEPYPEYKDSGVEWIGQIPSGWEFVPIKAMASCNDDVLPESTPYDTEIEYVDISSVNSVDGIMATEPMTFGSAPSRARRKVQSGDVIVSTVRTYLRAIAQIDNPPDGLIVSTGFAVIRPRTVEPGFLGYMLRSEPVIGEVIARSTGVSYPAINPSDLISIKVPVPRTDDQSAIKEFLDCETAKIDVLISEQQDLIALLREKRQAVISHTVTKGLNPNVPMKYSGIEWLGDVPEHWKVIAIKHIVSTPITDGPHETPDFPDEGIPFVSAEAIATGEIDFEKVRGFISRHDHLRYSQKYSPQIGDIYMVKSGATTGITAIVETDIEFNIWSPLAAIRCGESAIPKYILYFLRSKNFQDAVSMYWSFGTQQNIGMGVIENLSIALPPKKEQEAAVSFVDHQIDKIETLISDAESIISLLQEHRIALISAVVTGKVDVREVAYV